MTLPDERYRAIKWAETFLTNIASSSGYPRIPKHVRQEARSILRHYPSEWEMQQAADASPHLFQERMEPVTRLFAQYEQKSKPDESGQ